MPVDYFFTIQVAEDLRATVQEWLFTTAVRVDNSNSFEQLESVAMLLSMLNELLQAHPVRPSPPLSLHASSILQIILDYFYLTFPNLSTGFIISSAATCKLLEHSY